MEFIRFLIAVLGLIMFGGAMSSLNAGFSWLCPIFAVAGLGMAWWALELGD